MEKQQFIITDETSHCVLEISLQEKCFLWMQGKTGTTLVKKILKNFGFHSYNVYNGVVDFSNPFDFHVHSPCLFKNHMDFKFIATIRNPYTTLFSEYSSDKSISISGFKEFLEGKFVNFNKTDGFFSPWERYPDYTIRVENISEDYLKIPFIKNSELNTSGKLKSIIESKPNKNRFNYFWKDYYDKQSADLVYYNTSRYFDMFGYDKNSWKN